MKQNFKLRPLKGVKRKEQIEFDQTKMRFRNFVIQRFCLFREFATKTKSLNDKIAKTHFFWSNSIFSLRLTPFRGRGLKFCFKWSYFELCATLKHEKSLFSADFVGRTNSCAPQSRPSLKKIGSSCFHVAQSSK